MTLELVHKKIIDLNKAISLLTINPANVLNMHKPSLEKNKQADFIIFDENCPDVIKQNNLKTSPSPFDCRKVKGKVLGTFINGKAAHINQILEDKIIK
jgi:dihydroorotase-like cyclic amidohydrolase